MCEYKYEGGPIYFGGSTYEPVDYLLRRIGTSTWYRVIGRWGRHFHQDIPREVAMEAAYYDRLAMNAVLSQTELNYTIDQAREYLRVPENGQEITTLSFAEFVLAQHFTITEEEVLGS